MATLKQVQDAYGVLVANPGKWSTRDWARAHGLGDAAAKKATTLGIVRLDDRRKAHATLAQLDELLSVSMGAKLEAKPPAPLLSLDIVESTQGAGILSAFKGRKIISIRSQGGTITKEAFDYMGANLNNGDRITMATNPADKSHYVGIAPVRSGIKAYTIRPVETGGSFAFNTSNAVKHGIPIGVYEIIGKAAQLRGCAWFPLIKITD